MSTESPTDSHLSARSLFEGNWGDCAHHRAGRSRTARARYTPATPKALAVVSWLWFTPVAAQAYIGPGAGLSAVGSLLALLGAVLLILVGFIWYPVRRMIRRRKAARAAREHAEAKRPAK